MTPEEKALLERTYRLSEENNEILKGMRRSQRISSAMRGVYWALIIVMSIVGYYFFQSYLESILGAFGTSDGTNTSTLDLIEQYKELLVQ